MKMDGSCIHFFNRVLNAYDTGNRTRRRIITGNICDSVSNGNNRWHKTGSSKPVFDENGVRKGWKKILVLYKGPKKVGAKPERENWVMHHYHLGVKQDETNGEFVVCKVFYQLPSKKNDKYKTDVVIEPDASVAKINPRTPMTDPPQLRRLHSSTCNTEQYTPIQEYQGGEECGTSKMKVEAAECSACFAELSPVIPTSDEPICSLRMPWTRASMHLCPSMVLAWTCLMGCLTWIILFHSLEHLQEIFGQQDSLGAWPDGFL